MNVPDERVLQNVHSSLRYHSREHNERKRAKDGADESDPPQKKARLATRKNRKKTFRVHFYHLSLK